MRQRVLNFLLLNLRGIIKYHSLIQEEIVSLTFTSAPRITVSKARFKRMVDRASSCLRHLFIVKGLKNDPTAFMWLCIAVGINLVTPLLVLSEYQIVS